MNEFRLYYDTNGSVICYTCEDLPGENYIVIDNETFAIGNPFARVVDGQVVQQHNTVFISSMKISDKGIKCAKDDICIITDSEPCNYWEMKTYEFRS